MQKGVLKLRIYGDEEHLFTDNLRLVKLDTPQKRTLQNQGALFELPEGFEPMNRMLMD